MSSTRKLFIALGASAALTMGAVTVAHADPAPALPLPLPIDSLQAPGLPAMQTFAPLIQQAAADPAGATELLMAAARAFAGNGAAPSDSKNLANAVNQFASDPQAAHVPAPGAIPGTEAHLPAGIDPVHAVGPVDAVPEAAPAAAAVPAPAPAPAPAATPVSAPVNQAAAQVNPAPAATPSASPLGPNAPVTQDFMYPSISNGCLADGGNVLATAISVAGPAKIPTPGPAAGQMAYVFTAVGTPGPAAEQKLPLNVTWVNLTTGKSGSATLHPQADINPQGPTTLTAIVDTGSGSIMSTIFGQVTTTEKQCQFMPTIGSAVVP